MCGIAGLVWKDKQRPACISEIKLMTDIISYRGPDDEGHFISGPVALGHRRLAIIDLSNAGHQPMISTDGRYIIVFNGEIYNYKELARELIKEGSFLKSDSDTEVLLEAYRVWGAECVNRFNGMWAFSIFDVKEQRLFLSRDRFGIKPLYYINTSAAFAFASEIKGILAGFPEERKVNEPFVYYFLPSGALDDGSETFFKSVFSLPPAHSALYSVDSGQFSVWKYWDVDQNSFYEKWVAGCNPEEVLWDLLNSSIDLHLRADVTVGSCLSGGIDSSTIVGLASRRVTTPIYTFSGLYSDADCDESNYVESINKCMNTTAVPVYPEPKGNLIDDLAHITWHQDEPSAGPGLYTQYHVMKQAHKKVKVLLDGQGGDELFAGYLPYFSTHIEDILDGGKVSDRLRALKLIAQIYWHWGTKGFSGNMAERVLGKSGMKIFQKLSNLKRNHSFDDSEPPFFHSGFTERVVGQEIQRNYPQKMCGKLNNILYLHLVQQSIPALLHYEDRNSMAFSIEARVPLLDYRIVEFAMGLPSEYKIKGSWTKWILREAGSRVIPHKVAWRRSKMGYPTPFARWIRQGIDRELITDILFSDSFIKRDLVSEKTIRFYYDQHMSGKADRSWLLYRYICLELWYRMFIDSWQPNPVKQKI